jgi:hypothetical protein
LPPSRGYGETAWGKGVREQLLVVAAAIVSIVLAVPLIISLAVLPKASLIFQPLFQGAVVLAIGMAIFVAACVKAKSRPKLSYNRRDPAGRVRRLSR